MKITHLIRIMVLTVFSMLVCSLTLMADADEYTFYVSPDGKDTWKGVSIEQPFATIQRARDAIRELKSSGGLDKPVTVYLRGGLYELEEPVVFGPEDSGTEDCHIKYMAYSDEEPIISGGREITGPWKDYKGEIKVCTIKDVKNGKWYFRQLFIDGERLTRARFPNTSYYMIADTEEDLDRNSFKFRDEDIKMWKNLNEVEIVIFQYWNESRLVIADVDDEENIVSFTGRVGMRLDNGEKCNRYYVDNVLEGLDEPGEWYLDKHTGKLYLWPEGDLEDSELRAPVLNELFRFEGNIETNDIQYIDISGLTFCEQEYILPEEGIPSIHDVGDIWFPAALTLQGVSDINFENNTIRNTGTYGLDITGVAVKVNGNKIYDTGSGGVVSRNYGKDRNLFTYNHIHHCGDVFHSAVGINIDDGGGYIANNLVHHTGHSCIYGRHWATDYDQEEQRRNQEQGLIIEYNEVHHAMNWVNDGAGIFIRDDFIHIRNNLVYDCFPQKEGRGSPSWGIYLGCETRNCLVENNVVYRTQAGQLVWFDNRNNTIFNNIFIAGDFQQIDYSNADQTHHEKIRFFRNIIYFSDPDSYLYDINGERSMPMESDYNLIYNTEAENLKIKGLEGIESFEDWQELGFDRHSVIADPLFVDPENDDYSLRPESPAFKLGFKSIDLSNVGLRGLDKNIR
ncbi:right-handed parallel beta-helix repeat-containing protein [Bacteroidota bacterium]